MTLISSNIKENILTKINDILNINDTNWNDLDFDLKLKIIHNMCNTFKPNFDKKNLFNISIPLKNLRPKKIIEFCGINKQSNTIIFEEFIKNILQINRDFRINYNSKNKNYCFSNLSVDNYNNILNNYNYQVYLFISKYINLINTKKFYHNLIGGNENKLITNEIEKKNIKTNIKIDKINYKDRFLNIDFNNNISIQFELYLTSEKITSNIPAKYKPQLINIF